MNYNFVSASAIEFRLHTHMHNGSEAINQHHNKLNIAERVVCIYYERARTSSCSTAGAGYTLGQQQWTFTRAIYE